MSYTAPQPALALRVFQQGYKAAQQGNWASALGYFKDAFELDSQNLRYWLFWGAGLFQTGRKADAVKLWSLGADRDAMIRIAQFFPQTDNLTKEVSRLADQEIRRTMTEVQRCAILELAGTGRMETALWPQTHLGEVPYENSRPRPYMFFAPDLPDMPVFDRADVSWTQGLEAQTQAIREEFLVLFSKGETGQPYVSAESYLGQEWAPLKGQSDWTSIHLYQDGREMPPAKNCPQTCEILKTLPLVIHNGQPMEVFFSVLKAGTHIPPHYGLANCRLTVHLPLIIPENCGIRVGDIRHEWTAGETFMFDDSFNHEAWNRSRDMRTVLIFEAWRPDMTDGEIKAVEASYRARDAWLKSRNIEKIRAG